MQKDISGKDIADNIRAERNRADLTQEEVAKNLNVTLRTYISYENDAKGIRATTIYNLANLFGCSIDAFYVQNKFTKCER